MGLVSPKYLARYEGGCCILERILDGHGEHLLMMKVEPTARIPMTRKKFKVIHRRVTPRWIRSFNIRACGTPVKSLYDFLCTKSFTEDYRKVHAAELI